MIISAGAPSLGAFFVASILISMWLCGNFLKRYSVGRWLSFGGEGALNLFNGGRGNWAILGDFGIKFGESLKIISKKFAYV